MWQGAAVASDPAKRRTKAHLQQLRDGRAEEAEFDSWWDSLSPDKQAELRACDPPILPYRELPLPRFSFPIYATDKKFGTHTQAADERQSQDEGWVTRERVQEIVSDVLAMVGASPDKAVQHHFELMKIVLQTPDAITQVELAARMGLTKQAVCVRAKNLMARAASVAPGFIERIKQQAIDLDEVETENSGAQAQQVGSARNLFAPPILRRGSSTTAKKPTIPSNAQKATAQGRVK